MRPKVRGNRFALIGDSITAQHGDSVRRNAKGFLHWASVLSDQKIRYYGHYATGGYTTDKILNISLQALLSAPARPDYCVVLGGTNDVGNAVPVPSILKNLLEIYRILLSYGIVPIAATIPPRDGASQFQQTNIMNLNTGIKLHAGELGLPLVDFHKALTDSNTANYLTGHASDQIHPNTLGARVMGAEFAKVIGGIMPAWNPPLSVAVTDPANLISNPLFTVDANNDGTPDRWTLHAAAGATLSLEAPAADEPIAGKWLKCVRATDSGSTTTFRVATITGVNPGDRVAHCFKFKFEPAASGGKFGVMCFKDKDVTMPLLGALHDWDRSTPVSTVYGEFTVPAGVTALQMDANFSGAGTVWLAQMTMRNLTAAGIDVI